LTLNAYALPKDNEEAEIVHGYSKGVNVL